MNSVFLCYRRSDTSGYAGWLFEHLVGYLGRENIFRDIDSIPSGTDFADLIDRTLTACEVVLVLIGKDWLSATDDEGTRRLNDPLDHVRMEVAKALASGRKVIPVLVEDTKMPVQRHLPKPLKDLSKLNGHRVSDSTFSHDVDRLVRIIHAGVIESKKREAATSGTSIIEAGTEAKNSRFKFKTFFSTGSEFILTGTNFGDQMGDRDTPPTMFHQLIVSALKRDESVSVYLVVAPFELLDMMLRNSRADLQSRSAARLLMLAMDPRLTDAERRRLHIFDHRGATFLSVALRDPGSPDNQGLAVATPRWFSDQAGPHRMFFAIEAQSAPEVFKKFIEPIYPRIKIEENQLATQADRTQGGRSILQIAAALGVGPDPFLDKLASWPLID